MADYYTPTVIQPPIPVADMTPLERLLLGGIFTSTAEGGAVYFYAEDWPATSLSIERAELDAAFAASPDVDSAAARHVAEQMPKLPADGLVDLDVSGTSWEFFFQDIVRRSRTVRYVTAISSFDCSKMRPDAFGGMATLITADRIYGKSTNDLLAEFLADAGLTPDG